MGVKSKAHERRGSGRVHGDVQGDAPSAAEMVYDMTRRIPRGRVMSYGQIASLVEQRLSPRAVGWALHGCPDNVPWQRVVNASGGCSTDRLPDVPQGLQRSLLELEGVLLLKVIVDAEGRTQTVSAKRMPDELDNLAICVGKRLMRVSWIPPQLGWGEFLC